MFLKSFYVRFYHCTAYTVYLHCLHVRLLRVSVTLNINQSIGGGAGGAGGTGPPLTGLGGTMHFAPQL